VGDFSLEEASQCRTFTQKATNEGIIKKDL